MKLPSFREMSGKKKLLYGGAAFLLALVILSVSTVGDAILASAVKRDLPIYCVEKTGKVVALSFDAAWGNEDTQELIDILGKYDIKATFFVVGEWVDKYPESVKALHEAGHEIMNHSDDHPHMNKMSEDEIIANVKACNEKIAAITGITPTLFRAPYGEYNDKVVGTLRSMGMYTIQWDVDSLDWKDLSAVEIKDRVLKKVNPGSIVLFHNAAKNTPAALPSIIDGLIQKGYSFAPLTKFIMTENYEIDHSGKQISASYRAE